MKRSFKFSLVMFFILTGLLSGCVYPGDRWGHERGGDSGGDHGDRGEDRGGDRGGEHQDRR